MEGKKAFVMLIDSILKERDGFRLGEIWKYSKNAKGAIIPVIRDGDTAQTRGYVTLPEVKDKVQFSDTGHINKAGVKIEGIDKPLFIRVGSILEGIGTQSRGVEHSVIIMPEREEEEAEIDVKCVHASHPISYGSEFAYCGTAPRPVEHAFLRRSGQSAVWESVSNTAYRLSCMYDGSANAYSSYVNRSHRPGGQSLSRGQHISSNVHFVSDNLASIKKEAEQFDTLTKKILDEVPAYENQVGAIIFSLEGIEGIEVYDSPKSWEAQHKEVIEKYSEDLGSELSDVFSLDEAKAKEKAIEFLQLLHNASSTLVHSNGSGGEVYQITIEGYTGECTVLNGKAIHLLVIRNGSEKVKERIETIGDSILATPSDLRTIDRSSNAYYNYGSSSEPAYIHFNTESFAQKELRRRKGMDSVLRALSFREGIRWTDIYSRTNLSSATLSKRLSEAKELGLVSEDLQNGKKVYRLTRNGKKFMRSR